VLTGWQMPADQHHRSPFLPSATAFRRGIILASRMFLNEKELAMRSAERCSERQVKSQHRSVVAISEHPQQAALLDALLLDANSFDVIYVESVARGFSRIKQAAPDLVIVFLDIDDVAACQLLTMLSIDGDTAGTPVATWITRRDESGFEEIIADVNLESPCQSVAIPMN
jgi:PleD family two-component response regulator